MRPAGTPGASGRIRRVEGGFFELAHRLQCINHRVTPSPGKDRRRFQLVTPSRVASGGVFIAAVVKSCRNA